MKIFKNNRGDFQQHHEFKYEVGEPVEVSMDGKWELYEVHKHDDGVLCLEPAGYDFNSGWIYDLNEYELRQTPETYKKVIKIYQENIEDRQAIINHDAEKRQIQEIKTRIKELSTPKVKRKGT